MNNSYQPCHDRPNQLIDCTASKETNFTNPICNFVINTIVDANNIIRKSTNNLNSSLMHINDAPKTNFTDICKSSETPLTKKIEKYFDILEETIAKISCNICVNIGVNKKKSTSDEENILLSNETQYFAILEKKYSFDYKINEFFWEDSWVKKMNFITEVLKEMRNSKTWDNAAKNVKNKQDRSIPFQQIREHLKIHPDTSDFIEKCRQANNAPVYLCFLDVDTPNINNAFEEYMRIGQIYNFPTIMTTGFQYTKDKEYGCAFQFASRYEMALRSFINTIFLFGTYVSERNMCILVEDGKNNLDEDETFIAKSRKNHESSILISNILKNRKHATCVFSEKNPVITEIPRRIRKNKYAKVKANEKLNFTQEFMDFGLPSAEDFRYLEKISESHLNKNVLCDGLFCNGKMTGEETGEYKDLKNYASKVLSDPDHPVSIFTRNNPSESFIEKCNELKNISRQVNKFLENHESLFQSLKCYMQLKNICFANYDFLSIFDLKDESLQQFLMDESTCTRSEKFYKISQNNDAMLKLLKHIKK